MEGSKKGRKRVDVNLEKGTINKGTESMILRNQGRKDGKGGK